MLSQLVVPLLDLALAFGTLLLHLDVNLFELFLLFNFKLLFSLSVLGLGCHGDLELKLLLYFLTSFDLSLNMLLLELLDLFILLLLELIELLTRLLYNLFDFWVYHHLFHLKTHLRLEAKSAKFALSLANGDLVVFDRRLR